MKRNFAAIILGGTGQVGGATVAELLATPECREAVMVTRKPVVPRPRVRNVVLDTGAADFAERTATLACEVLSQGPVSAVSCVGVGSGSMRWSEEELHRRLRGLAYCIQFRLVSASPNLYLEVHLFCIAADVSIAFHSIPAGDSGRGEAIQ